jgi:hypothetical protein
MPLLSWTPARSTVRTLAVFGGAVLVLTTAIGWPFHRSTSLLMQAESANTDDTEPVQFIPDYTGTAAVIGSLSKDSNEWEWMCKYLRGWSKHIYVLDDKDAVPSIPKNKGGEAMAYLSYVYSFDFFTLCPGFATTSCL